MADPVVYKASELTCYFRDFQACHCALLHQEYLTVQMLSSSPHQCSSYAKIDARAVNPNDRSRGLNGSLIGQWILALYLVWTSSERFLAPLPPNKKTLSIAVQPSTTTARHACVFCRKYRDEGRKWTTAKQRSVFIETQDKCGSRKRVK